MSFRINSTLLLCLAGVASAQAQIVVLTGTPEFLAKLEVEATVGVPVQARLLLDGALRCVRGQSMWLPMNQPFELVLSVDTNSAACTRQAGPDNFATPSMVFARAGIYNVRIIDQYGTELARQAIGVSATTQVFSRFDVAGNWYQPSTSGSGLIVSQRRSGTNDQLFGVWHAYDSSGKNTWHSLQNGIWQTPTRVTGTLYSSLGGNCTPNFIDCGTLPSPAYALTDIGSFELEFSSENEAQLTMRNREGLVTTVRVPLQRVQ
jgi:hypothetical protein